MKLGIITDIHSNIVALNEVLEEFEKIKIDKIICCGVVKNERYYNISN